MKCKSSTFLQPTILFEIRLVWVDALHPRQKYFSPVRICSSVEPSVLLKDTKQCLQSGPLHSSYHHNLIFD